MGALRGRACRRVGDGPSVASIWLFSFSVLSLRVFSRFIFYGFDDVFSLSALIDDAEEMMNMGTGRRVILQVLLRSAAYLGV